MSYRKLSVTLGMLLIAALHTSHFGNASESRDEIIQSVLAVRERLQGGLHVQYSVRQAVTDPRIGYGFVHFGGSADGSALFPFWHAEHAMAGSREYHRSSSDPAGFLDTDRTIVIDDKYYYGLVPATRVVDAYEKSVHELASLPLAAAPVEELYWELIGYQSRSHKRRTTIGDADRSRPYDLLAVLADGSYVIETSKDAVSNNIVILSKPGVERIELDPRYDYAITRRERNWNSVDTLKIAFSNSKFEHVDGKVWLPKESEINYYPKPENSYAGSIAVIATMTVDRLSLTPPESLLTPDLGGMIQVMDLKHKNDGKVEVKPVFINELDGSKLSSFLKDAPRGVGPNPYKASTVRTNGSRVFAIVAVVLVVAATLLILVRRNRV